MINQHERWLIESWSNEVDAKTFERNEEWRKGLSPADAAFVERLDWMNEMWSEETNDPDSEWWRETLNEIEAAIVQEWDDYFEPRYEKLLEDVVRAAQRAKDDGMEL